MVQVQTPPFPPCVFGYAFSYLRNLNLIQHRLSHPRILFQTSFNLMNLKISVVPLIQAIKPSWVLIEKLCRLLSLRVRPLSMLPPMLIIAELYT